VLALSVGLLAACGGAPSQAGQGSGSVTFAGWGGAGQKALSAAYFEPFEKATGVKVVQDTPASISKMQQMVAAKSVVWDILDYGPDVGLTNNPDLEMIDCTIVPCADFADAPFKAFPQGIPMYISSFVLTYNTKQVTQPPRTRAEAWFDIAKYPGKRAVNGISGLFSTLIEPALIADGVKQENLYPIDLDRALRKLEEIKDHLIVYKESSECVNLVSSGEAVFGDCYNTRAQLAKDEGLPVDYIWSQQTLFAGYAMVPKGSPNKTNAMKLIAFMADRTHSSDLANHLSYGWGNPLSPAPAGSRRVTPVENMGTGGDAPGFFGNQWWIDNRATVIERMAEWFAAT
jgi:putative spermidine/putrescine transport system substrate-binding protein